MLPRTHLIRIQRSLYDRLRAHARNLLGGLPPELKKYFQEYQKDFQDFQEISTKHELLLALLNAHVVFCGDYHTLSQAQRTVIRLLRDSVKVLKRKRSRLVLALEMVRASDNAVIEEFLGGRLSEARFLQKISFDQNWGFSWTNYRELFEFAREFDIKVVGINAAKGARALGVRERDRFAARVIADLTAADEHTLVFVLVGDLHLAQVHLPRDFAREIKKRKLSRHQLTIHQNSERFYWKLVELGLEQFVDVVKMKDGVFCVMNTPPWVKLQSHLQWVESENEEGRARYPLDASRGETLQTVHYHDEVRELITLQERFLGIEPIAADDFEVRGPKNLKFLEALAKRKVFSRREIQRLSRYCQAFESQFIPRANIFYLTSISLNHAASQAAIYLHAKLSHFDRVFEKPKRDFYTFVWVEALGFLGSKVVNHKRKCNGPLDLKRFIRTSRTSGKSDPQALQVAKFALEHLEREARWITHQKRFAPLPFPEGAGGGNQALLYYKVAKVLGQLLGQALFTAVFEGRVEREELIELFHTSFLPDTKPRQLYLTWIRRLDRFDYRDIAKRERL